MSISAKTIHDLEWQRLLDQLAKRCASEAAAQRCRQLPFLTPEAAWRHMVLVNEFLTCIHEDDNPPNLEALPVEEPLAHVRSEGDVPAQALLDIATNLKLFVSLNRYLDNRKDVCPKNAELVLPEDSTISPISLARLAAEIESTFEPDGTIRDSASAELSKLRKRVLSLRQNLLRQIESIAEKNEDILRDKTITMRNDRYVLPVRTDAHRPLVGIVHGSSGTGATTFIEPQEAVEAGNELMLTREKIIREENRILSDLRDSVKDQLAEVHYACRTIIDTETRIAAARMAWDMDAAVPQKGTSGHMNLKKARHPLLCLEGVSVIPSDISISPGNTLLVSGPNAGGKTVILKTVGIFGLMLSAGLPISAAPESQTGIPRSVLSDIGDDQSLELSLSTYSAHMKNIASILEETQKGCIVLLDEVSAGTDPVEGTALAEALLNRLNQLNATTLATTHFDTLKTHAQEHSGFTNAAMGFDTIKGIPTYKIHMGIPGSSSAFSVAKQFGIPESIIEEAKQLLPEGVRKLTNAVEALETERQLVSQERETLAQQQLVLDATIKKHNEELARISKREEKFVNKETEALWASIRKAREQVREAEKTIRRRKGDPVTLKNSRGIINKIADQLTPGSSLSNQPKAALPGIPATIDNLSPGCSVHIVSMNKTGVVDSSIKGNTAYIRIGTVKMRVSLPDLRVLSSNFPTRAAVSNTRTTRKLQSNAPLVSGDPIRTESNTLDLRGTTVDEAIARTDAFLDQALKDNTDVVFVLHGHGTGALRNAIREYLNDSPYVSRHRPGTKDEGGDGITTVWMR